MGSTNSELGKEVHNHLVSLGIETPKAFDYYPEREHSLDVISDHMEGILDELGMHLHDDSIRDTPRRVAKMFVNEIFYGLNYNNFPACSVFENKMQYDELVCVKGIQVRSVCEHHLVPFIGNATVAYIPTEKVVGLSKFHRVVDFFCRRPQVQERLTAQIHAALSYVLDTEDVAVIVDSEHFCVKLRGVQEPHSSTVTSKLSGRFRTVDALRSEFLALSKEKSV